VPQVKPTLLITSAAYADDSICVELGRLPPSFLPLGNKRLYAHQIGSVGGHFGRIVLSLPESFVVPPKDLRLLAEMGADIERVPDGLSLGHSVAFCLRMIEPGAVAILHGDTLIYDIEFDHTDGFTCHTADEDPYRWAVVSDGPEADVGRISEHVAHAGNRILSGFFSFSDSERLIRALTVTDGDFIEGLRLYNTELPQKALRAGDWFDFGHFHTYYRSKTKLTTQRAFNGLQIDRVSVTKTSSDAFKMSCEAHWLKSLPDELKLFIPTYLGPADEDAKAVGYRMERLLFSSLNDMFIFGRLNRRIWDTIFEECTFFLRSCKKYRAEGVTAKDCNSLYLPKTEKRLVEFAKASGFPVDTPLQYNGVTVPSLRAIAEHTSTLIPAIAEDQMTVMHGDFCFSNILYDSRGQQIRTIDPRGYLVHGEPTLYGDPRYDVAKLFHSAVGFYDLIVAGYYTVAAEGVQVTFDLLLDDAVTAVRDAFLDHDFDGIRGDDPALVAIAIHLFLSMLPLHHDNPQRQLAFLANACRLYLSLDQKEESLP
jgi:hypothetical protein